MGDGRYPKLQRAIHTVPYEDFMYLILLLLRVKQQTTADFEKSEW